MKIADVEAIIAVIHAVAEEECAKGVEQSDGYYSSASCERKVTELAEAHLRALAEAQSAPS